MALNSFQQNWIAARQAEMIKAGKPEQAQYLGYLVEEYPTLAETQMVFLAGYAATGGVLSTAKFKEIGGYIGQQESGSGAVGNMAAKAQAQQAGKEFMILYREAQSRKAVVDYGSYGTQLGAKPEVLATTKGYGAYGQNIPEGLPSGLVEDYKKGAKIATVTTPITPSGPYIDTARPSPTYESVAEASQRLKTDLGQVLIKGPDGSYYTQIKVGEESGVRVAKVIGITSNNEIVSEAPSGSLAAQQGVTIVSSPITITKSVSGVKESVMPFINMVGASWELNPQKVKEEYNAAIESGVIKVAPAKPVKETRLQELTKQIEGSNYFEQWGYTLGTLASPYGLEFLGASIEKGLIETGIETKMRKETAINKVANPAEAVAKNLESLETNWNKQGAEYLLPYAVETLKPDKSPVGAVVTMFAGTYLVGGIISGSVVPLLSSTTTFGPAIQSIGTILIQNEGLIKAVATGIKAGLPLYSFYSSAEQAKSEGKPRYKQTASGLTQAFETVIMTEAVTKGWDEAVKSFPIRTDVFQITTEEGKKTLYTGVYRYGEGGIKADALIGKTETGKWVFGQPPVSEMPSLSKYASGLMPQEASNNLMYLGRNPLETSIVGREDVLKAMNVIPKDINKAQLALESRALILKTTSEGGFELPKETVTMNKDQTKYVIDLLKKYQNKGELEYVYGSFPQAPQQLAEVSRIPKDIEPMFKSQAAAIKFQTEAFEGLQKLGFVGKLEGTGIVTDMGGGSYAHALDIKFTGQIDFSANSFTPISELVGGERRLGVAINQPRVTSAEGLSVGSLQEQAIRKITATQALWSSDKTNVVIEPAAHRAKDIADTYANLYSLSEKNSITRLGEIAEEWKGLTWQTPGVEEAYAALGSAKEIALPIILPASQVSVAPIVASAASIIPSFSSLSSQVLASVMPSTPQAVRSSVPSVASMTSISVTSRMSPTSVVSASVSSSLFAVSSYVASASKSSLSPIKSSFASVAPSSSAQVSPTKSSVSSVTSAVSSIASIVRSSLPSTSPSVYASVSPSIAPYVSPSISPSITPSVSPSVTPSKTPGYKPPYIPIPTITLPVFHGKPITRKGQLGNQPRAYTPSLIAELTGIKATLKQYNIKRMFTGVEVRPVIVPGITRARKAKRRKR